MTRNNVATMRTYVALSIVVLLAAGGPVARAAVKVASIFSDGLVLQRDVWVPVWGTATAGAAVRVTLGEAAADATADDAGKWKAYLPKMPADATPRDLVVTGDGESATVRDVVVGDVWLCSGQSNMGYALLRATDGPRAVEESADPLLREFKVSVEGSPTPMDDVTGRWRQASPDNSKSFSAVGYFFASKLRREVGVPIGIVHASKGGSPIEAWSRREALEAISFMKTVLRKSDAKLAATTQPFSATQPYSPLTLKSTPGWLYNDAIAPLIGFGIRGIVWYQGESNLDNANEYRTLFPAMIRDWRKQWGDDLLPFLFVQLAAREDARPEPYGSRAADVRLAQTAALDLKNTAMAVAIDTTAADWHPADKRPVGERLANAALKLSYQRKIETSGPLWAGRVFRDDKIVLRFLSVGGLRAPDGKPGGFTIAGADRRFVPAEATIVGETIEVRSDEVPQPVAVRYGWSTGPTCNLTNAAGLPAAPFRTDDWPSPTTKPTAPPRN